MKRRNQIVLLVVLVALVGIRWMQHRSHESSLAEPDRETLLPGFSMDSLSRVELRGPASDALVLERKGEGWVVASRFDHPAKSSKIDELAGELEGLTGQFRSDREDVLPDYGLADTTAVSLELYSDTGEQKEHLLLGSAQPRGGGLFLCRAGSNRVYASQSRLLSTFGLWGDKRSPDARGFLDMTLWSWDKTKVESFALITPDGRLEFTKAAPDTTTGQAPWLLDGTAVKSDVVDQVLTTLMNLKGRDLLDPGEDHGLAEASRRVEIRLEGGESKTLLVGESEEEEKGDVPIRVEGSNFAYALYSSYPNRIFKKREDFTE